ncbi:MAG: HEAT repeat domain-containing protein [Planctomycetota bacterium]|jgi:HEAT repeat protein
MDRWLGKIVALLREGDREQRRAAARVLAALQPPSPEVVAALGEALETDDRRLKAHAVEALGAIGGPGVIDLLLPLLDQEGELGRRAAVLLADADPKVLAALRPQFDRAGPTARRRMLAIAGHVRGAQGMDLIVRALEKGHAQEVLQAGDRLAREMEDSTARERGTLVRRVDKFLLSATAKKDTDAAGAAVDLLARILGAGAAERLLSYAEPGREPFVRRRALEALARVVSDVELPDTALTPLLAYLKERDYANVVAPAMAVLERAHLSAAHAPALLKCLHGNDPALRRFAVAALGQVDTPKSAEALLNVLRGDNPDLRKRAAISLAKLPASVPVVVSALCSAEDAQVAWVLARILHPHVHRLKPEQVTALARATAAWLEPGDSRAEAVITLLADRFLDRLAEESLKRIRKVKRERNAGAVVNLLRPLLREGVEIKPEIRYEIALAEIVMGPREIVREVRLNNPGLLALEPLLHEPEFGLPGRIKREKQYLEPEEFLLIGCHFAERPFLDRAFGGDLLRWIVKTFPEDASSPAAANKLVMEGFPPPPPPKPKPAPKPVAKKAAPKKAAPKKAAKKAPKKPARKPPKKAPARKKPAKKASKTAATKRRISKSATKSSGRRRR